MFPSDPRLSVRNRVQRNRRMTSGRQTFLSDRIIAGPVAGVHPLGHSLISIVVLSATIAGIGGSLLKLPLRPMFAWCLAATFVHDLTDLPYWWGVQFFWPFSTWAPMLKALEYLDLFVLGIWLAAAICLARRPNQGRRIARISLTLYAAYVLLRYLLPAPTGLLHQLTGGRIYMAPNETPILDWW